MNKAQLIDKLSTQLGSKKAATDAVDAVIDTITRAVASGERVAITGFGVFEKVARPARVGRNPRTGAAVKIKKTTVPKFKAGQGFKDVVSGAKKLPKAAVAGREVGHRHLRRPAKKTTAKKTTAKKTTAKKAPPRRRRPRRRPRKKAPAKKAPPRRPRPRRRPRASASPTGTARRARAPERVPGPVRVRCALRYCRVAMVRNVTRGPSDLDAHPLADPQQPDAAGVERRPVVGELGAVVEQHGPGPAARVEAAYRRLHPPNLSGPRSPGARCVQCAGRPRAHAEQDRGLQVGCRVDVPAQRRQRVGSRPRGRPTRHAGPPTRGRTSAAGPRPPGPAAGSSRCPPRPGRSSDRAPAALRSATASSAGRSAGRSAATVPTDVPGWRRAASAAPWTSAALRPASGSSAVTSAPAASSARAASGSSVTTCTAATRGQASAAAAVSSAKARARALTVAVVRRPEPGLRHGQALDRQHQAPPSARVVHAPDPASRARHRDQRTWKDVDLGEPTGSVGVAGRRGTG